MPSYESLEIETAYWGQNVDEPIDGGPAGTNDDEMIPF